MGMTTIRPNQNISRQQFKQTLKPGVRLNHGALNKLQGTRGPNGRRFDTKRLKAMDQNNDGKLSGRELDKLFSYIDDFDKNGSSKSFKKAGPAGAIYRGVVQATKTKKADPLSKPAPGTNVQETTMQVKLTLSDGRKLTVPKYSENNKQWPVTSVVDPKTGKMRLPAGTMSKRLDSGMRTFLKSADKAIGAQETKIAAMKKGRGLAGRIWDTLNMSGLGSKVADAQRKLTEMKRVRDFGVRSWMDSETTKPVMSGVIGTSNPLTFKGMTEIWHRGNKSVIKEVQRSPAFYRGLGSVPN